jgi:hypothetical protein
VLDRFLAGFAQPETLLVRVRVRPVKDRPGDYDFRTQAAQDGAKPRLEQKYQPGGPANLNLTIAIQSGLQGKP